MELREPTKLSRILSSQLLTPWSELHKENRSRFPSPQNPRKPSILLYENKLSFGQKTRSKAENPRFAEGKVRFSSPAVKKSAQSFSPGQSIFQAKFRAMLPRKLNVPSLHSSQANNKILGPSEQASPAPVSQGQGSLILGSLGLSGPSISLGSLAPTGSSRPSKLSAGVRLKTQPDRVRPGGGSVVDRLGQAVAHLRSGSESLSKMSSILKEGTDLSSEVQLFLDQSKTAGVLESLVAGRPGARLLMLPPKYSLLLVLFVLNSVEIAAFRGEAIRAIELALELFSLAVRALLDPPIKIDSARQGPLGRSRAVARLFRAELAGLCLSLHRSRDLSVRVEGLALDAEGLNLRDAHNRAFRLFEALLSGGFADPEADAQVSDRSLLCGEENPNFIVQPLRPESLLPQRASSAPPLTLVLDLDETLVHLDEGPKGHEFLVRPHVSEFIALMSRDFELVVFTAAERSYADWILDRIDLQRQISHRLYHEHTKPQEGVYLKDLCRLGRDLAKVIIVDNTPHNFYLQPDNGIYIKTWHNDPCDVALLQLARLLSSIARQAPQDVRAALRKIHNKFENKRSLAEPQ